VVKAMRLTECGSRASFIQNLALGTLLVDKIAFHNLVTLTRLNPGNCAFGKSRDFFAIGAEIL
jgi:hypothetical protein